MPKGRVYKTKAKGAQEAHESIRPTSFGRDPDSLESMLKPEEYGPADYMILYDKGGYQLFFERIIKMALLRHRVKTAARQS